MVNFAVFDLDDTLVDSTDAIDRWFAELARQRELGADGLEFLRAEQQRPVAPQETFRAIVERFGFSESPAELQALFWARWPRLVRPFDGVIEHLRLLRASGWRLAVLTNGPESVQRLKMGDELAALFDAVCFADGKQVPLKPDPESFRLVARRAAAELEGAWMVGDSLAHDVAGATAVGMETIWISGGRKPAPGEPLPGRVVATVTEAFRLLLPESARGLQSPQRPEPAER